MSLGAACCLLIANPGPDREGGTTMGPREDGAIFAAGLTRFFDGFQAARGVSFGVQEGEIFGFLSPNGAGKTTTIRMLCTPLRPSGGEA